MSGSEHLKRADLSSLLCTFYDKFVISTKNATTQKILSVAYEQLIIKDQPLYGHLIRKYFWEKGIDIPPSTIYQKLKILEEMGLIIRVPAQDGIPKDPSGKVPFMVTPLGRQIFGFLPPQLLQKYRQHIDQNPAEFSQTPKYLGWCVQVLTSALTNADLEGIISFSSS